MKRFGKQALLSWGFLSALFILCGILGFLQYRWIGEVSRAERERLGKVLQATLDRLSQDFDAEIAAAYRALMPTGFENETDSIEAGVLARYKQWAQTARHDGMIRRVAVAQPRNGSVALRMLEPRKGVFEAADWPEGWSRLKTGMESYGREGPRASEGPPRPLGPPWNGGTFPTGDALVSAAPLSMPGPPAGGPFERREMAWLIVELDTRYMGEVMLPEAVRRHFGAAGSLDYQVAVLTRGNPPAVVYQSDPGQGQPDRGERGRQGRPAGAATQPLVSGHRSGPRAGTRHGTWPRTRAWHGSGPAGRTTTGPGPRAEPAMWDLFVRHRAGSLEAVVSRTPPTQPCRDRGRAAADGGYRGGAGALHAAGAAAGRIADGIRGRQSRTSCAPRLTVIHTAAYNLQGKLAANPAQVERYGALIQRESGRLKELVEQALQFAGAQAGRVVQQLDPLSIEAAIDEAVEASRAAIEASGCAFVKEIQGGLPPVLGDPAALPRALHNLLANAAKYGAERQMDRPVRIEYPRGPGSHGGDSGGGSRTRHSEGGAETRFRPVLPRTPRRSGPGTRRRPGPEPDQEDHRGARGQHTR